MSNRCRICGEPKATQALFNTHPEDCDCAECCAVCWREFGQRCDEPDAAALLAEIDRLRALVEAAYREGHTAGAKAESVCPRTMSAEAEWREVASDDWHDSDACAALNNNTPQEG